MNGGQSSYGEWQFPTGEMPSGGCNGGELFETIPAQIILWLTVGDGVGLGLSISFHIVKKNKSQLQAASRPGKGTTFILEFPAMS
jgi:hypothetical protein